MSDGFLPNLPECCDEVQTYCVELSWLYIHSIVSKRIRLDAMGARKFFIEKGDFAVDESLSPEMRKHFRAAALYNQIFPEETFMLDMLVRFRNHEPLTDQFDEKLLPFSS